jgi:hypothetical protein
MLPSGVIAYGAALSALLAVVLVALIGRQRSPGVLVAVAVGAFTGPVAWNAIVRATAANQFFVDAPIPVFPVSWQDTGSGVFTLAALAVLLGLGPLRNEPGRRLTLVARRPRPARATQAPGTARSSRRSAGQASHVPVAQRVEHAAEQFTRGGDLGQVLGPAPRRVRTCS